jgi:uncharacterized protein YukE
MEEIKLDYGLAEDMVRTFQDGVEQWQETLQAMQDVAKMLEEGALLGEGGEAFVDTINSSLSPSLSRLTDKYLELVGDVRAAINYMREADKQSAGFFKS